MKLLTRLFLRAMVLGFVVVVYVATLFSAGDDNWPGGAPA